MAKETQIGQLVIDLKIKTEALEKGLETAKKRLEEIERQNEQVQNSNKGLDASFIAMSAGIVASMNKVVGIIKEATEEYKSHVQAMSSLSDVAEYTENSLDDMSELMNKYSKYMTKADLASTIKNFSLMGMSIEQTDKMLQSLINSAIKNRNANYDVSTAVKVASDGYKQGLSTLSDSAGVTENLSVMLDKYAESLGKTASKLTEEEQNQAYVNRTMEAAAPFAGAMSEYLDTLAGKQGEYNQALRETQVAYTESIEPLLSKFEEFKTIMMKGLSDIISENESATVGLTTFMIALGGLSLVVIAGKKVIDLYTASVFKATLAEKGFAAAVRANPAGLIVTGLALLTGTISAVITATNEYSEAQNRLNELQERYNKIQNGSYEYTDENIAKAQADKEAIEQQIELLTKKLELEQQIKDENNGSADTNGLTSVNAQNAAMSRVTQGNREQIQNMKNDIKEATVAISEHKTELNNVEKELEESRKANGNYGNSIDELNDKLKKSSGFLDEANVIKNISKALDVEKTKTMQKEAAEMKANANQMQAYLNVIKKGDKTTTEYKKAETELAKAYGEASTAAGINIDTAQGFIDAEQMKADETWKGAQDTINAYIAILNKALESETIQKQVAQNVGISWEELVPRLSSVLKLLQTMAGYTPDTTPNIAPTTVSIPKSSGSSSYSNKKLDNYKKEIEHKKALDQISLKQEIAMYETALRSYAKTADEKMELREKIYALNKELAQKEKEVLDEQTEDYEAYIQQQINARGAEYDATERTRDYDKIISMHRNYLNQIMKDERLSLDERKQIYREELSTIRDYEQQKRDLRIEAVDNTVTQLTNAITKQLEEQQKKDTDYINEQIEQVEKLKKIRIDAINAEYDAKIEAIEKELQALDKAEQQKSRDEEDAEYERKRLRLEQLVAFEHDATTKANYQKELDKLVAEYQKKLDKRVLEDKKEALNEQKDLLKEEQDNKTQAIEDETEKQKEIFNKQLEDLEKYYSEQVDMAQQTAEKMLINVEQNQDDILNLLKSYGNAYEITGQTLGEKLAQGINEGIANKIENVIQNIQDTIDRGIENKIAEWNRELYKYEVGANKPQITTQTINVTQQNYIEQNPELPSETHRKLRNVSEDLAAEIAGL